MAMARAVLAILLALTAGCANPPRPAPPSTAPAYVWVTFDESTLLNSGASGLADRRTGRPLTIDDPVRIASISKLRSEEHTSELQSLMRISYAVFCLKKKKKNTT